MIDVEVDVELVPALQAVPVEGDMPDDAVLVFEPDDVLLVDIPVDVEGVQVVEVAHLDGGNGDQQQANEDEDEAEGIEEELIEAANNFEIHAFINRPAPPGRQICCCECGPCGISELLLFLWLVFGVAILLFQGRYKGESLPGGVASTSSSKSTALVPFYHLHVLPPQEFAIRGRSPMTLTRRLCIASSSSYAKQPSNALFQGMASTLMESVETSASRAWSGRLYLPAPRIKRKPMMACPPPDLGESPGCTFYAMEFTEESADDAYVSLLWSLMKT